MGAMWPPPPDMESIRELVRAADPEGHLAEGAAADEYEPEEDAIFAAIADWPTAKLTVTNLLPVIAGVWLESFRLDDAAMALRQPALEGLSGQIARFFGPEARPRVRSQPMR